MAVTVSMFGTLPPLKAISVYCWWLAESVAREQPTEFFTFEKLYPERFYPGGTKDDDADWCVEPHENLTIHRTLKYYNPFGWIWAGFKAKGELIHAQWWSIPVGVVWIVILTILKLRGRRILLTVHNVEMHEKKPWYKRGFERLVTRTVFALADDFCAHCDDNAKQLTDNFGIAPERIHVMPIPVYEQYCDPAVDRASARERLGIDPDRVAFLLFGNHRDYKGTDVFLEAAARLSEAQRAKLQIMIVGQVWGEEERYERLIAERGLDDCVFRAYGYVPMGDVKYYFEATDVVALPYKNFAAQSGVGSLVLAFGKALLVTRCGGLPTLVKRPEALCEPDDVDSLHAAIARILDAADLLEAMAADSRELAANCTWDAATARTLEIYQNILAGPKGTRPAQPE